MASISFKVGSIYCYECVMALRKFIGDVKGVRSVDMIGDDRVVITYDPANLIFDEGKLRQLVIDSIDKLGFKIIEE